MAETEKRRALTVHGLKNCDTCRKALGWLAAQGIDHSFRDLRADGLSPAALDRWIAAAGWETLLNRRSTTWRDLTEADKRDVDEARARALMIAHPTLIKRPVIEVGAHVHVGFSPQVQAEISGKS